MISGCFLADSSGNDRTAVMTVYCNWDTLDVRHSEQSWELG